MLKFLFLLFFSPLVIATSLQKNDDKLFPAELISPYSQIKKGESFLVGIKIKLPQNWHSYWSFAGDFGQAPQMIWKDIEAVERRALPFPRPKRKSFFINKKKAYSFIYEKELLIPYSFLVKKDYKKTHLLISLNLRWFVCKEICLSKEKLLTLNLPVGPSFQFHSKNKKIFHFWKNFYPKQQNLKSTFKVEDKKLILSFSFKEEIKCLDLFPEKRVDFSTASPSLLIQSLNSCVFEVEKANSNLSKISGLLVYSQKGKKDSSLFHSYKHKKFHLLWFILMAFIGGLILNIMPCVLPIVFLKFYNTLELKELPSKKIIFLNLSYVFGVIVSFLCLAFFIFISKKAGTSLGWGFHLQSPAFVTFLALLFLFMAFYLVDFVSIPFPKFSLGFKEEKFFPHFLTGVLSTTAASPCTVPFMASAVGFAFSRSYLEIFLIFSFLGLGLSFPYIVLSFFPKALRYIPSPGKWTEILKKLFAIPLFLTVMWLLRILYLQLHPKAFFFSFFILLLFVLWILFQKKFRLVIAKKLSLSLFVLLSGLIFVFQGFFHKFFQAREDSFVSEKSTIFFKDIEWKIFDKQAVLFDKQQGKNIFISFGAEWCLTCQLNERVFETQEFKELVKERQIVLYYGDWTSGDLNITKFLNSYGQKGVPFYIFYKGEERVHIFPTLLLKSSFLETINSISE